MTLLKFGVIAIALIIIIYLASLSYLTRHNRIKPPEQRQLEPCPATPNCVSSLSSDSSSRTRPFAIDRQHPAESWNRLKQTIEKTGGEILLDDGQYLHAVFTSSLFRFRDDLEARLENDRIDLRSASRAGTSDMGVNRKRVRKIRQLYSATTSTQ